MANDVLRAVVLKVRPSGEPTPEHFEIVERAVPQPGAGEVLTRTIWLSIDPYMRGRLKDVASYAAPVQIGEVMTGENIGEVIASGDAGFAVGDIVGGARGWQSHAVSKAASLVKLDRHAAPLSAYLGVLGMPGTTAYSACIARHFLTRPCLNSSRNIFSSAPGPSLDSIASCPRPTTS